MPSGYLSEQFHIDSEYYYSVQLVVGIRARSSISTLSITILLRWWWLVIRASRPIYALNSGKMGSGLAFHQLTGYFMKLTLSSVSYNYKMSQVLR